MSQQIEDMVREIDETAVDVFDLAARREAKDKAGSRRDAYEKGLRRVREITDDDDAVRELSEWIQEEMRSREKYPSARNVRQQGAKIVRDRGHEVSTNDWLGA
ncbi:hypothetical protein [Halomicrobium salinisoli]|uniref:hypothetical protein n=1 Tax=Halomicrobium salinisoli TaxID=2878391 RepID=UPI001CEFBAA0|nr:hypothetical protein [Halomicrobium salinisoli]